MDLADEQWKLLAVADAVQAETDKLREDVTLRITRSAKRSYLTNLPPEAGLGLGKGA